MVMIGNVKSGLNQSFNVNASDMDVILSLTLTYAPGFDFSDLQSL